jgi:hypothetical protein
LVLAGLLAAQAVLLEVHLHLVPSFLRLAEARVTLHQPEPALVEIL